MLPDFSTCRDRIGAYKQGLGYARQLRAMGRLPEPLVGFMGFWNYRRGVEDGGNSILDDAQLPTTAAKLRLFLIDWGMRRTGIASNQAIEDLLRNIRPHYQGLRNIALGSGQIQNHRQDLEDLYKGLDGITNLSIARGERHHGESSITGKSKAIIAIWGQTPAFDRLTRKNLCQCEWTHLPDPGRLPPLEHQEEWYTPSEFADVVAELDDWVGRWLIENYTVFGQGFAALDPNLPVGRIVDEVYNWEYEWDSLLDYLRLEQAQNHLQVRLTFAQLPGVLGYTPAQLLSPGWLTDIKSYMDKARRKKLEKARMKNKTAKPSWQIADLDFARQSVCFACD